MAARISESELYGEEALLYAERFGVTVVLSGVVRVSGARARELLKTVPVAQRADLIRGVVLRIVGGG